MDGIHEQDFKQIHTEYSPAVFQYFHKSCSNCLSLLLSILSVEQFFAPHTFSSIITDQQ